MEIQYLKTVLNYSTWVNVRSYSPPLIKIYGETDGRGAENTQRGTLLTSPWSILRQAENIKIESWDSYTTYITFRVIRKKIHINICPTSERLLCLCNTSAVDHVYIRILWAYTRLVIWFEILCTSPGQRAFPFCSQYKVPLNRHDTQPGKIFPP